jgi:hypothetical protein
MYQLFLNLIGKTLKFNRKGIPHVVNLDSVKIENDVWVISMEDNGFGIREEHVDKLYKTFKRLQGRFTYEGGNSIVDDNQVHSYFTHYAHKKNGKHCPYLEDLEINEDLLF